MKKLILALVSVVFIFLTVFFLSFSSFSEDDGCVVVLNSFKSGIEFEDLVFTTEDEAGKCNKYNTLILNTLNGESVLKFSEPAVIKKDNIFFFVSSIVPEKRAEDPTVTFSEQHSEEIGPSDHDSSEKMHRRFPGKESDFVIYYLYNNPLYSAEEIDDALLDVQEKKVNLILTGNYYADKNKNLRPDLTLLENSKTPELSVLVFSVLRLGEGEKKIIIRSFHRRKL